MAPANTPVPPSPTPPAGSLAAVLQIAGIGTYEWDAQSRAVRADHNLGALLLLPTDPDRPRPSSDFVAQVHPEDRDRLAETVRTCRERGDNFEVDFRTAPEAGGRWLTSRGQVTRDASGQVVRLHGVVMDITDRKRAEEERAMIADRLRRLVAVHDSVLSSVADFIYIFDREGRFQYANPALLRLYNRNADEILGRTFSELGYPAWLAEQHLREIAQVIATRKPVQGEVPFRGESGLGGMYNYIFTPIFDAQGEVEAVGGTTRDVTGQRRAEARNQLLVALDDVTRPLTDATAITQAAAQLLGEHLAVNRCAYAEVEDDENTFNLTGDFNREVPSIVGRYRFDQFGEECLRLMRAGEPYVVSDAETDPRTAAVREAYQATLIRAVICVPLHKAGRFVGAMAVHQKTPREWHPDEIETAQLIASRCWESIERARVVRVLAESEQRLRLAVTTGRLGIWELDLPDRNLAISDQGRAIHGRAPGESFGYPDLVAAVHPDDRERVRAEVERSVADCSEFELEYRVGWPGGATHWVLVRGQCSRGPDGRPARLIGVMLDITSRKEVEHEQVRLREEAVRALRAKDDFLAALSHELRTPLNPILLIASDSATDATLPAHAQTAFEIIRRNVELEARLIDDLLDLTSIIRGKIKLRPERCDLHDIIGDAVAAVQPYFDEKDVELQVTFRAEEPSVVVDEVRIAQVFMNVLKNAAKFTPRGGYVKLSTQREGNEIVTRVVDTGIGMTEGERQRAFVPFEQGEHARTPGPQHFGGLGLGLSIAWQFVQKHAGQIVAESDGRDRGTTITITLPTAPPAARAELSPGAAAAPVRGALPSGSQRILVVEDHDETRQAIAFLLSRRGYHVVPAASMAEALDLAEREQFDLVISDLGLPDGDGTTLMAQLHVRHGLLGIALTGFGMDDDVNRCRAAGFVHHLTKPVTVRALEGVLREALAAKK